MRFTAMILGFVLVVGAAAITVIGMVVLIAEYVRHLAH